MEFLGFEKEDYSRFSREKKMGEEDSMKEKKICSRTEFNFKFVKQFYSFLNLLC